VKMDSDKIKVVADLTAKWLIEERPFHCKRNNISRMGPQARGLFLCRCVTPENGSVVMCDKCREEESVDIIHKEEHNISSMLTALRGLGATRDAKYRTNYWHNKAKIIGHGKLEEYITSGRELVLYPDGSFGQWDNGKCP